MVEHSHAAALTQGMREDCLRSVCTREPMSGNGWEPVVHTGQLTDCFWAVSGQGAIEIQVLQAAVGR